MPTVYKNGRKLLCGILFRAASHCLLPELTVMYAVRQLVYTFS